jgi:phospholipid-binding lipoprotein MlaA
VPPEQHVSAVNPMPVPLRPMILCLASVLAACAATPPGAEYNDPYEAQNRGVHQANKEIDQALFGGGGRSGIVPTLPVPVARGLSNATANLGAPSNVVNSVLQGRPEPAITNTLRFVINSTVGIAGLFDPATAIGVPRDDTDFGETLAVWGAPEGAYQELPFLGPSTERDTAGKIVDWVLDPVGHLVGRPEGTYITGIRLGSRVGDRQRFADTYESILYDSADSYAQARLLYLQNRRFDLGEEEVVFDPYEDPYGQ